MYFVLSGGTVEWHTLHRIEGVSNLISLLREYETNARTRNATHCNNHDDLLNLSFLSLKYFFLIHQGCCLMLFN